MDTFVWFVFSFYPILKSQPQTNTTHSQDTREKSQERQFHVASCWNWICYQVKCKFNLSLLFFVTSHTQCLHVTQLHWKFDVKERQNTISRDRDTWFHCDDETSRKQWEWVWKTFISTNVCSAAHDDDDEETICPPLVACSSAPYNMWCRWIKVESLVMLLWKRKSKLIRQTSNSTRTIRASSVIVSFSVFVFVAHINVPCCFWCAWCNLSPSLHSEHETHSASIFTALDGARLTQVVERRERGEKSATTENCNVCTIKMMHQRAFSNKEKEGEKIMANDTCVIIAEKKAKKRPSVGKKSSRESDTSDSLKIMCTFVSTATFSLCVCVSS